MKHRVVALLGAAALGSFGLTGCTSGPGAAAFVGSVRISVETLQQAVNRGLANPAALQNIGGDRARFTRQQLGRLINDVVVSRLAAKDGVTVSASDVEQQIAAFAQQAGGEQQLEQQASASGIPAKDLPSFVRYYVMQQKVADKLVSSVAVSQAQLQAAYQQHIDQYDQVNSAHILVASKALADQILAQVKANPSSFASLAAKYSTDPGSKNNGGNLGFQSASALVKPFAQAIFAAKPGAYLEVHSQFGWHVVHVIAHRITTLAQVADQLKQQILQPQRDALLKQALTTESHALGVHVNPRYGSWNFGTGVVDPPPTKGGLSTPATPSPSPASS